MSGGFFARVGKEEKESDSVNYDDDLHEIAQRSFPDFRFLRESINEP